MLFDEEYAKTKMLIETRLREADCERLAQEARRHTQQVLRETAQSLRANHPTIGVFEVFRMLIEMMMWRSEHAN